MAPNPFLNILAPSTPDTTAPSHQQLYDSGVADSEADHANTQKQNSFLGILKNTITAIPKQLVDTGYKKIVAPAFKQDVGLVKKTAQDVAGYVGPKIVGGAKNTVAAIKNPFLLITRAADLAPDGNILFDQTGKYTDAQKAAEAHKFMSTTAGFLGGGDFTDVSQIPEQFYRKMAQTNDPGEINTMLRNGGMGVNNAEELSTQFAEAKTPNQVKQILINYKPVAEPDITNPFKHILTGDVAPETPPQSGPTAPVDTTPEPAPQTAPVETEPTNSPAPITDVTPPVTDNAQSPYQNVQRFEEPGVQTTFDKPQGLYTTPSSVESPHADLGGQKTEFTVKPDAKILTVNSDSGKEGVRGLEGQASGARIIDKLATPELKAELASADTVPKTKAILFRDFPELTNNKNLKFHDVQDVQEAYAGMLARKSGYDVVHNLTTKTDPLNKKFEEVVLLNKNAVTPKNNAISFNSDGSIKPSSTQPTPQPTLPTPRPTQVPGKRDFARQVATGEYQLRYPKMNTLVNDTRTNIQSGTIKSADDFTKADRDTIANLDVIMDAKGIKNFGQSKDLSLPQAFYHYIESSGKTPAEIKAETPKPAKEPKAPAPTSISEVVPPKVRGDIQSPKLHFDQWKDKATPLLARETFERNIEKVAPKQDADALKAFIVNPVRANETARVKFNNTIRLATLKQMRELGITRNSQEDTLIQKFGEGQISLTELQAASPKKWGEIQQASGYFRDLYDKLLDQWNGVRAKYGYPAIPKRPDYFRHFDEINFFTKTYGLLNSKNELPSSIAGKTEFFKPGKPFSTAELRRTGNSTKYSAIGGINNYIDSVSKQIFHIDSIQRGRALERYFEESAKTAESLATPLHLSNIAQNIREYVNNGLAGKTATIDRAVESILGRPAISAFQSLSKLIGKNIIVGNLSTALSHLVSLPLIGATTDPIPLTKGLMTTLTSPFYEHGLNTIDGQESAFLTRRFPVEDIMPTLPKKIETALSYVFSTADKFKSRLAVAGKYYEGLHAGLSPQAAMQAADTYAGRVIGDYSLGQKPNLMNAKLTTLLAQFQLGLNDSISVLMHDIPESAKTFTQGDDGTFRVKKNRFKVVKTLAQYALYAYLFNMVLKNVRGSGKGIDPIDLGMTLTGLNAEGEGQSLVNRVKLAGTDLAGELPFSSAFTGNYPLSTALVTPFKDFFAKEYKKMAESIASDFVSPVGGGLQAVKTLEGVGAIKSGEAGTRAEQAQAIVFGPSVVPNSAISGKLNKTISTYQTKLDAYDPNDMDAVQAAFDQAKTAGFGTPEADDAVNALTDPQYKMYRTLKSQFDDKDALDLEPTILPIVQKANDLGFGTPEADTLVTNAFPDTPEGDRQYSAFKIIKNALYGTGQASTANTNEETDSSGSDNGVSTSEKTYDQHSLLNHIYEAAVALKTDPVTTFKDLFAGNSSYRIAGVENGQVIVVRAPQKTTDAIKASQGAASVKYKLDHTIPLEIGGNNSADNLLILDTGDKDTPGTWAGNTATEDLLGNALKAGKITGKQAREYIIRYKAGVGEPISKPLLDEYKNKYGGVPLTTDEIEGLINNS